MNAIEVVSYYDDNGERQMCFFDPPVSHDSAIQWVDGHIKAAIEAAKPEVGRCWERLGYPVFLCL